MVKKIKSPSCGPSWCKNHLFELNPLKSNLYFKKNLKIRLCPKHNKAYNTFENILPIINKDHKYYTPFFILQDQKKFYNDHDQRAKINHQKLQQRQRQDESYYTIYEPKHGRQNPYCSVCEKKYNDYMEHIQSTPHKLNLQNCIFTRYIMQIQQNFKQITNQTNLIKDNHQNKIDEQNQPTNVQNQKNNQINQFRIDDTKAQPINPQERPLISCLNKFQESHLESLFPDVTTLKQIERNW